MCVCMRRGGTDCPCLDGRGRSTAENWLPSGKPASGEAIVLDARGNGYPLRWDAAMKGVSPAGWTQDGYTESVTFETVYDSEGFDKVTIDGDVILMSGSWTHLGNSQSALYRLFVEIAGKMTIGAPGNTAHP